MNGEVLELDRVSYWYPDAPQPALDGVSLSIGAGELVVLAGLSGSGKSTLLRTASGLVPHFHGGKLAGTVAVAGMDTRTRTPAQLAAYVGTLFQDPETQVVMNSVRAELAFPLENRGDSGPAVARGVEEAALALGIGDLLDRPTSELSGGELQRVALAAALAGRPSLIVLDEPTSQLDPVVGDELIALLRRINEDSEATVVISEHRLERCLSIADRVIAMDEGRIVCDAPPREFLAWACAASPALATPGARLLQGLGLSPAAGVKAARAALRANGYDVGDAADRDGRADRRRPAAASRSKPSRDAALRVDRVWHEISRGPTILRGVSLSIGRSERVALMGRNGAGKSTLLRHAAGLMQPTRGRIQRAGRVALLLQNPTDYLVHETVAEEASSAALASVGLAAFGDRHPRDLSGGEKQRLALAIVLDDEANPPAVVCLDEPTRGMDRTHKHELARLLCEIDAAVLVATHDPEFVAEFADRVVLLADGAPIADGPAAEVLSGGTYFATETARILGGAGGALTPDQGIGLLQRAEVPA
ncbi:MAG TPA: ATP-binding cassette domain-containing protein [Solirubrobacteraceae bacterium]|nr:ATP-binding cassette domain-containing protein [Solirubrobacteraceae bacterium]